MTINFGNLVLKTPLFTFDFTYNLMRSFIAHTEDSINASIFEYIEKVLKLMRSKYVLKRVFISIWNIIRV